MAEEDDFTLLPADDAEVTPEEDVAAAVASALNAQAPEELAPVGTEPYGRSWAFDFARGRFVRDGNAPRVTTGLDTLRLWCLTALVSARYAHGVFTPEFGMEEPEGTIGVAGNLREVASDYGAHLQDALLVHDRVASVDEYEWAFDAAAGALIVSFIVVTDEDETLAFNGLSVTGGSIDA